MYLKNNLKKLLVLKYLIYEVFLQQNLLNLLIFFTVSNGFDLFVKNF